MQGAPFNSRIIEEMSEEYMLKTIDENNLKPTSNSAISGIIGCFGMLMLHKVLVRIQSDETLAT